MTFVEAIKTCLLKYADFEGRATREEYWWFFLAILIGSAITSVLSYKDYTVFSLVTILPLLAAGARRLHDINKSGWWQLLGLVPFGIFVVFIFLAQPAAPAESR